MRNLSEHTLRLFLLSLTIACEDGSEPALDAGADAAANADSSVDAGIQGTDGAASLDSGIAMAVADGPETLALWHMEGGPLVLDDDANFPWRKNHLEVTNGAVRPSHPGLGQALSFDGENTYAQTRYSMDEPRGSLTVDLWLRIDPDVGQIASLLQGPSWRLWLTENGTVLNWEVKDAWLESTAVQVPIRRGEWLRVVASFDHGAVSLSAGDKSVRGATFARVLNRGSGKLVLGRHPSEQARYFKGTVDEVHVRTGTGSQRKLRGNDILWSAFYDVHPDNPKNAGKGIAARSQLVWVASTLKLKASSTNVDARSVSLANQILAQLSDPNYFEQIERSESLASPPNLYWVINLLLRTMSDPQTRSLVTVAARDAIHEVLDDFVTWRDRCTDANLSEASLLTLQSSINHDWIKKTAFYLVAQYYKSLDSGLGRNIYADGLSATEHFECWERFLMERISLFARKGLDAELAQPVYNVVTLDSILLLRDLADTQTLRKRADDFLNLYLADAAIESFYGVRGGAKTRMYIDLAWDIARSDEREWTHVLYNQPNFFGGSVTRQLVGIAMSDFEPHAVVYSLATRPEARPRSYAHTSKRLGGGHFEVGFGGVPINYLTLPQTVRRYTAATREYILGVFAVDESQVEGLYVQGNTQNQWMGIITRGWAHSRVFLRAGTLDQDRVHRGLNGIASGSSMLVKRQSVVSNPNAPLVAYLSDDFRRTRVGPTVATNNWIFAKNMDEKVYVALKAVRASSPRFYSLDTNGPGVGDPLVVTLSDSLSAVAVEVVEASRVASFEQFQKELKERELIEAEQTVTFRARNGRKLEVHLDGSLPELDGATWGFGISDSYVGPLLRNHQGDEAVIEVVAPEMTDTLTLSF